MNNGLSIKILTMLLLLVSTVTILARAYPHYVDALFKLSHHSVYMYYLPLSMIVMAVFILTLLYKGEITGVNIIRLIIFISFLSISILLYVVSYNAIKYVFELKTLSIIFFIWSLLSLAFNSRSILLGLLLPLTLLLLIPIPYPILLKISMLYTGAASASTMALMNTIIDYSTNNIVLRFIDHMGLERIYEISPIGINCITIVFIIAPIIGYMISYIKASKIEKLLLFITASWISSAIVLLSDSIRIFLAVFIGEWNYEVGELLTQQISSMPGIVLALLVPIHLIMRRPLERTRSQEDTIVSETVNKRWIISIILMVMTAVAYPIITSTILHEVSISTTTVLQEFPHYISDHIVAVYNTTYSELGPVQDIGDNGSSSVECILINYRGYDLRGYIEEAYEPEGLIPWPLSTMVQGYLIVNSWIDIGNVSVTYMLLSRSDHNLLLAYTVYAYPLNPENMSNITYTRVSLFTEVELDNYGDVALAIRDLLNKVDLIETEVIQSRTNYLDIVGYVASISILLSIITLVVMNSNKLLSYLIKHFRRGGR